MATSEVWEFEVRGSGDFPTDMLRYDACYPKGTSDAIAINSRFRNAADHREIRTVKLVSTTKAPTEARWASFGWTVRDARKVR